MKAVYYDGGGQFHVDSCQIQDPGPEEVTLKVAYCGVCGTDMHIAHGAMDHRIKPPQVIGHEMCGTIATLGEGVTDFSVGQAVVVRPLDSRLEEPSDNGISHICRKLRFIGIESPGAFQAYWTVPAFTLHALPETIDLQLAAFVEPLAVAMHANRLGSVAAGESVLVIGGGPIGLLVALAARERGALVTIAEVNAFRRQLAEKLDFAVIDSGTDDLEQAILAETNGAGSDVVFEVSGSEFGARAMTRAACLRGRIVVVAIFNRVTPTPTSLFEVMWKELSLMGARVYEPEDFDSAIALIGKNTLPLRELITEVAPIENLPGILSNLGKNPEAMKVLIDCQS